MARPSSFRRIYLDSSALIAVINGESDSDPVKQVLELADRRQVQVLGSPVLLVEVRGQRRGNQDPDLDQRARAILAGARLTDVEFSRRVALRARDYVGRYNLRPLDAIHLASAVDGGADVMWTLDRDFRSLWQTTVDGVWVDEPYEFGQQSIPGL